MNLILTDAGRNAIADGQNQGINQVTVVEMAIGDARAPAAVDDTGRVALRNERLREAVGGTTAVDDRFAVTATFSDAATWSVTEAGLFARIGAEPKFLFAYFAVGPLPAAVLAQITPNTDLLLAGVVQVVASPAAVAATVDANVTIEGPDALLSMSLHTYAAGANEDLVASARPRRWLVTAIGGGGGGGSRDTDGSAGGSVSLIGPGVNVTATGGPGGTSSPDTADIRQALSHGAASVAGARAAGAAISGGGGPGGDVARQNITTPGGQGAAGGKAVALVSPMPGATYAVLVGAIGAGGGWVSTHQRPRWPRRRPGPARAGVLADRLALPVPRMSEAGL